MGADFRLNAADMLAGDRHGARHGGLDPADQGGGLPDLPDVIVHASQHNH
ncbi:hypothetical protein FraEuI1c_2768 [Pseudofrankia inefficax]|uniref:Uncharacterized protein n=1 Tax=Pseudofrankia inefficax (strain DSM 45817 / CECT 9037 / DDB 130130 / EuI1c) TaxID=298654 RepID=E3J6L9_PSEI1|nr:hypothetical protein FraEuI1c_2768 [Pseudofrankia inefficax]